MLDKFSPRSLQETGSPCHSKMKHKRLSVRWHIIGRDIALLMVFVYVINQWQSRNMLDVDQSLIGQSQSLVGLDGETAELVKPGKATLVYFFAPWCAVCSYSIGNLEYLDDTQLNVVRVALDYASIEEVKAFAEQQAISSQILLGHQGLKQQFKIQGYPTYYIIDENHKVLAKSYGYSTALGLKLREVFSG